MTELYIDADACPVKNEIYKVAQKYELIVYVVSNSFINLPKDDRIRGIFVGKGIDVADDWIVDRIGKDDIAITADIPLADRCIKKGARVMGMKGREFTENSIGSALANRELMDNLRMMGIAQGGPAPFIKKDRSNFIANLHQLIQSILRP